MSVKNISLHFLTVLIFMIAMAAVRIFNAAEPTAWTNFTPIGAMALFGGTYFRQHWKAFAFPLLTLLLSDIIIHTVIYHGKYGGRPLIYVCFVLIVLAGRLLIKKVTIKNVALAGVISSVGFWLIADFAVWASGGKDMRTLLPLSRDFDGLLQCYWQGIPFMRNFLLGTLVYSAIMFGLFEWMQRRFHSLNPATNKPE